MRFSLKVCEDEIFIPVQGFSITSHLIFTMFLSTYLWGFRDFLVHNFYFLLSGSHFFFFVKNFLILRAPSAVLFVSLFRPKFYLLPRLFLREFHISSDLCSLALYMLQLVAKAVLSHLQFLLIYSLFHVESKYEGWLFLPQQFWCSCC